MATSNLIQLFIFSQTLVSEISLLFWKSNIPWLPLTISTVSSPQLLLLALHNSRFWSNYVDLLCIILVLCGKFTKQVRFMLFMTKGVSVSFSAVLCEPQLINKPAEVHGTQEIKQNVSCLKALSHCTIFPVTSLAMEKRHNIAVASLGVTLHPVWL